MKTRTCFVLLLAATATVSYSQTVVIDCPVDECHVLPYFKGNGGLVGFLATGASEATYVMKCGTSTISSTWEPQASGVVAELFTSTNGLACGRDDGELQIQGLADGAWYWINSDKNSAVASLVPKAALTNSRIAPANPGSTDLRLTPGPGGAASFLEHTNGRIGILSHFLPVPAAKVPTPCGQYKDGEGDDEVTKQHDNDCMLDASYYVRVTTGPGTGADSAITSGRLFRLATGERTITLGLYGTGHLDIAGNLGDGFDDPLVVTEWVVSVKARGLPGLAVDLVTGTRVAGLTANLEDGTITVHGVNESDDYCTQDDSNVVDVEIKANAGVNQVLPAVGRDGLRDLRPVAVLGVYCPSASASQGQSLVPENPFPTGQR